MKKLLVVALLCLLPSVVGAQEFIRYYPPGGLATLTGTTTATTTTVPFLIPDGSTTAPGLAFSGATTTGIYRADTKIIVHAPGTVIFNPSTSYGILYFGSPGTFANGFIDVNSLVLRAGNGANKGFEFVNGALITSKSKTLTDNTATAFVRLTVADDDYEACAFGWTAYAEDADTDARQVTKGRNNVAILNNGGTETCVFSASADDVATNATAGTLACTFDCAAGTSTVDLRATCNTSLDATAETLTFEYRLDCESTLTVTPQ
jgi:hypothetical protein